MRRFWSDLLASLYNIRDGIVQKKQELDEERAACEQEKEELRGQVADLEEEVADLEEEVDELSAEKQVELPIAVFYKKNNVYNVVPFSLETESLGEAGTRLYLYHESQLGFLDTEQRYEMFSNMFYVRQTGSSLLRMNLVSRNTNGAMALRFVNQGNNAYDFYQTDYLIDATTIVNSDNLDLDKLYFIHYAPSL